MTDNPYTSPQLSLDEIWLPPLLTITRMVALVGVGLSGGAAFGALTNAVNGAVCPRYFLDVTDWYQEHIWFHAVVHGGLEGAIRGLVYALIFVGS